MRISFTYLVAGAFLALSLPASAQNTALNLTGKNYVVGGPDLINPNASAWSLEFWAKVDALVNDGQIHPLVSEGTPGLAFYVGYAPSGNIVVGDYWDGNPGEETNVPMPVGRWAHFAVTNDGATTRLFIDAKQVDSCQNFIFTDGVNFQMGLGTDPTTFDSAFAAGKLDEVKAWTVTRSAADIKHDMFGIPDISDPTLVGYFPMNEGSGIAVNNIAIGPFTGTVQDGQITDETDPTAADSWAASPVKYGNNGLSFDGTAKSQVIIPARSAYDIGPAGGTVEFWVNPTTLDNTFSTVLGNRGPGGVRYSFHLSSTQIGIDNGATSMNTFTLPAASFPSGFPTNKWSHLAFVYNGTSTSRIYFNGVFIGSISATYGSATLQPLTLGIAKNKTGADDRPFSGSIDEVRIWNKPLEDQDILNQFNYTLTGTEDGLTAQFSFDEGTAGADNSGLTTAIDNTPFGNNGTLTNFALTAGSLSNFGDHALNQVPLPLTLTKFTAVRSNDESVLQWETAMEQNTRDFTVEKSTDGKTFTSIGVVGAAGNSAKTIDYSFNDLQPVDGNNYYRLKQSDLDGNFTYSPVRTVNFVPAGKLIWYPTSKQSAEVDLLQGNNELYILSDLSGRTLRRGQLSSGKTQLSYLPSGIYIVQVLTQSGTVLVTKILLP
jgi:hypothetical protein